MAKKDGKKKGGKSGKKSASPDTSGKSKGSKSRRWTPWCAFVFGLVTFTLGVLMLFGCCKKSVDMIRLAEISTNATYDVRIDLGYFGGCVTISNILPTSSSTNFANQTSCLMNMRPFDVEDLPKEFWEIMSLPDETRSRLNDSLSHTMPLVRHLQEDVFPASVPIASMVLFVFRVWAVLHSAINPSPKRVWTVVLAFGVGLCAFAFALAFSATLSSLYAINGLVQGGGRKEAEALDNGIFLKRGKFMWTLEGLYVGAMGFCYFFVALVYILAPSGKK